MHVPCAAPSASGRTSTRLAGAPAPKGAQPRRGAAARAAAAPTRRELLIDGTAALLLLATPARAAEDGAPAAVAEPAAAAVDAPSAPAASTSGSGQQVYLDVKVEGQKLGRITIELLPSVAPVGAARFADLAVGKQGVSYRLARFDRVTESYVRCEGAKSLSYVADGESPIAGGDSTADLEAEMASPAALRHDAAGLVSLSVKEEKEREVKERLVAMRGKLVTVKTVAGEAPNGSSFAITLGAAPELDATNLVVGCVVGGMEEVVARLAALPRSKVRDEWFDKPFFEAGKAIGDKRAIVAEKGFNRPFKRAIVSAAGLA
ncbi:peptidyl-prolyl cis-trans isomerase, chloroplastic [Raphidocelis subcapitata]|uniref:Peptidyl-prolyl cis-trans isomerase, chloroplastic n=1 Tax=Raphidocelis subcapitata TaxID=307507 RepID=A0A2V0P5S5_9CHLO|nr:peptidyl-prolyl cis-trans isomerase, chloroplastic [Raphidocelis subcapitata]|eukprot:GBF92527.1 peptidyl-prolyl cis-trans isomerase, chloroplastic [Raphidocelis subcapitata]